MGFIAPVGGYVGAKPDFFGQRPGVYRLDRHYDLVKRFLWPIPIGTPMAGGYYAGSVKYNTFDSSGNLRQQDTWLLGLATPAYHLIMAPKASGEASTRLKYKTTRSCDGAISTLTSAQAFWDGFHNTYSSVIGTSSSHPAANYCQSLTIGGYSDWYLPAIWEADHAFGNLMTHPDWQSGGPEAFTVGTIVVSGSATSPYSAYWSSSGDNCENTGVLVTAHSYWVTGGYPVFGFYKDDEIFVRAIRRIPFSP